MNKRFSTQMSLADAETLALQVSQADYDCGRLYPPLNTIRQISLHIAVAVAELAFEKELARAQRPENITAYIQLQMFELNYPAYV